MDTEWLKTQFRLHPEKNKAGLARAMGLEPPAVSKMLAGTRQIKAQEYVAMRRFFGLPVDSERAVAGRAAGDGYVLKPLQERETPGQDEAWIMPATLLARRTKASPEQVRVFEIQDSTMAPDFQPGEHVLVDLSDTKPSPPGVFLVSDGVGHILRHCEIAARMQPVQVRLSANNRNYEAYTAPLDKAGLVGRVIAKLQWL
jgi:hypothetical protein